jgi:hypothetical protein
LQVVSDSDEILEINKGLHELVKAEGMAKMAVHDLSSLICKKGMAQMVAASLLCESLDSIDAGKLEFAKAMSAVKQLSGGAKKAATKLKSHIDMIYRSAVRDKQKVVKQKEKVDLATSKRMAKDAANAVETGRVDPLFADWDEVCKLDKVVPMQEHGTEVELKTDLPCIVTCRNQVVFEEWLKNGKVQLTLSNFAAKYKSGPTIKVDNKAQIPICTNEGKDIVVNRTEVRGTFVWAPVLCSGWSGGAALV